MPGGSSAGHFLFNDSYPLALNLIPEEIFPEKVENLVRTNTNDKKYNIQKIPVSGYILS